MYSEMHRHLSTCRFQYSSVYWCILTRSTCKEKDKHVQYVKYVCQVSDSKATVGCLMNGFVNTITPKAYSDH